MATGATPLFGTITWLDSRQTDRDPASHGIDLALELDIARRSGELPPASASGGQARASGVWGWVHHLPFVGTKH